jgi:hypothetical protein
MTMEASSIQATITTLKWAGILTTNLVKDL